MNKKIKLLTSIASLCLALGLMTFGVVAAVSGTLTVTNSVSFNISNELEVSVFGASSGKVDARPTIAGITYDVDPKATADVGEATLAGTWAVGTTTLDVNDDMLILTLKVVNDGTAVGGASLVKVELTFSAAATEGLKREVFIGDETSALTETANKVVIMAGDSIATSVGYEDDLEFQVVFTLENKGASINDSNCGFALDLTGVRPAA